ncbi:dihydrodipicolinate synthase family protein [Salimicrobium halophilum]|uniref:Dihydrodipicolinate synthase/N-acetylneuraminate lyase n=1 Tax=Salimicrobium halophilum TaxID=86666 RepID=A0A1G8S962_9BACI|nr:dihydrodipicolinate synthase family protein [Salimicrobium halophilum]SDJ25737.1 Dihydrodipicolinate synthase/N-acetylneuraminate lyase [Salimicrobium halophilum]
MMNKTIEEKLKQGAVIPAHPLALNEDKTLDETGQRALTRYYIDAGAGGIAVGVHTTQFEIRDENMYGPVLRMALEEVREAGREEDFIKVAGLAGPVDQAVREAAFARSIGYDLGLLSMGGLDYLSEDDILDRAKKVAGEIPLFGFYLQPAVGGRNFSYEFWKAFAEIPNVRAIKIAPFSRYQTLDVVRAVCESSRREEVALYTGNDDTIVHDLMTTYVFDTQDGKVGKEIVGGLLGHWAIGTKAAVELFDRIKEEKRKGIFSEELMTIAQEVTDRNAALFDARNGFKGSIAGINEVLKRQGLLKGNWCLREKDSLSPGQKEDIDRVLQAYPHLSDEDFVAEHVDQWKRTGERTI